MKNLSGLGWIISLASFVFVLLAFGRIWPLASVDVGMPKQRYIDLARDVLAKHDIAQKGFHPFVSLAVRSEELDILQDETSLDMARRGAGEPNGMVRYFVRFKKSGTPKILTVVLHPGGELIGFTETLEPGEVKESYTEAEFRKIADELIRKEFQIETSLLEEAKFDSEQKEGVTHYRLDLRRPFEGSRSLDEIFAVTAGGTRITALGRRIEMTESAQLAEKKRRGPEETLSQLGFLLMGIGILFAYIIFLFELKSGKIELTAALKVAVVLFGMVLVSSLLDSNTRFLSWDPIWPKITMWIKLISQQCMFALWALLLGWTLLAAGTYAPGGAAAKMATFWEFASFRWNKGSVAVASLRGGAIGFVCGAIAILIVSLLETIWGGNVGLQPREFFLAMLDRQVPALAIVLFFFPIAVVEEAGYRLFAGIWIRHISGSKILAIVLPALVFGMIHTSLGFLPPENPWWGRALLMFVIGLVWGWAFFRFDFLTVVLCHFMADVVIFSWPLLMSHHLPSRILAGIGISVALWPFLFWLFRKGKCRWQEKL